MEFLFITSSVLLNQENREENEIGSTFQLANLSLSFRAYVFEKGMVDSNLFQRNYVA